MGTLCAAIDFGTNSARLLIAERTVSGLVPVHVEREVVRLGGGFTDEYGLSDAAQQRGLACLRRFAAILERFGIGDVTASATSAVRDAVNGKAFVDAVIAETGITLSVIGGELEARLTLDGVLSCIDSVESTLAIVDIGGGSTEFIVSSHGTPQFIRSMPMGVVRLTEGFPSRSEMVSRVEGIITTLENDLASSGMTGFRGVELVGTAGTATTIAAIKLHLVDYDYRKVNNTTVERSEVGAIFTQLSGLTPQERLKVAGVEPGREDLIIAGLVILMAVMDRFGFTRFKVSDFGLLEGLALAGSPLSGL